MKMIRLNQYSFRIKPPKELWFTLAIDSLTVFFVYLLFSGLGKILTIKAKAIGQGMTLEQLKVALLTGTAEANKLFYLNARNFVLYFIIGTILVLFLSLVIYSLSRKLIWQRLAKEHFMASNFWRWALLALVQIFVIIIFGLVYLAINLLFSFFGNGLMSSLAFSLLAAIFFTAILCFLFISELSFTKTGKVWPSILNFSPWKKFWNVWLLSAIAWFLLRIIVSYPLGWINKVSIIASDLAGILILLIFISGLRLYIFKKVI